MIRRAVLNLATLMLFAASTAVRADDGFSLSMDRASFAPSERPVVSFRAPAGTPADAWVGVVPTSVPHGSGTRNDQHDIQFQNLNGRTQGTLTFQPVPVGSWTLRLNIGDKEAATVSFTVANDLVPPGQKPPSLTLERTRFAPSERATVKFTAPSAYPADAWVGIVPAGIEHGSMSRNDQHDVQYQNLNGRTEGTLTFMPVPPGRWSLRMNVFSIETASADFEVANDTVPPGQKSPSLVLERARYAPGESVTVTFTAPAAYPADAWVGIVPAGIEHGSMSLNDQHDVQYHFLNSRTEGTLTFRPVQPGRWSLRMNAFSLETASADFEVAQDFVPAGMNVPALGVARARLAPDERIQIHFTAPGVYPADAWIGIIPAAVDHGLAPVNDQHDVQYQNLNGRTQGVLTFANPGPGDWTARLNVFGIETASVSFSVVAGMTAPAVPDAPFALPVVKSTGEATPPAAPVTATSTTPGARPNSVARPAPGAPSGPVAEPAAPDKDAPSGTVAISVEPASPVPPPKVPPRSAVGDTAPAKKAGETTSTDVAKPAAESATDATDWVTAMPALPATAPARFVDALDLRDISREEYVGLVSHAKESVAELLGPATAAQAKAFDASWQPMFAYPAPECIEYLEKLIPIAEQALALRVAMIEAAQTTSELWERAAVAEYYAPEAARELMLQVRTRTAGVASLKGAIDQLVAQIDALGSPPDPTQLQAQAQARHRRALHTLESLLGGTPELAGFYERTGLLSCTSLDAAGQPIYVAHRTGDGLHTRAIKPLRAGRDGLVLFSELEYHEAASAGGFLQKAVGEALEDESWNAWYAEPTEDGWVHYDYDAEDGTIDAVFYRPGPGGMAVDRYWIHKDMFEASRHVYHRAPLDAGTKLFAGGDTEASVLKKIDDAPAELAAMEAAFRAGKAAFARHLGSKGLPELADPEELHWVLKDTRIVPKPEPRRKEDRYYGEGSDYDYQEVKTFEHGANHFSTVWSDVAVTWTYTAPGAAPEVPEGSAYVAAPDEEFVGEGPTAKATEKRTPRSVSVHWTPPPPVLPDGGFWAISPTVEGRGGAFAINSMLQVGLDGPVPVDMPVFNLPGLSNEPRGLLILPHPVPADAPADPADEKATKRQVPGGERASTQPLCVSLRSPRLQSRECRLPVLAVGPTGYVEVTYIYEQHLLDEDAARALAASMDGRLPAVELSQVRQRSAAAAAALRTDEALRAEAQALQAERIAVHEANIAWSRREVTRLEAEMGPLQEKVRDGRATAEEIGRFNQLQFRLVSQQSQVVSGQDRIQEEKTGVATHSRTPFDELCRTQMIQKCRESVRDLEGGIRARRKAEYLMERMAPEQRRHALDILERIGRDGGGLYAADYARLNEAMQNIFQGDQEYEQAQLAEKAAYENAFVEGAEYVKTGADVGLMVTSMGGGPLYVNIAYQMATGTIEKDFTEGVKRGISTYSDAADTLIAAYDGWRTGGAWGAVEGAAWSIAMNKGPEAAMGRLNFSRGFDGGYRPVVTDGPAVPRTSVDAPAPGQMPSSRGAEAIQAGKFKQEMEYGEALAQDYFRDYTQWRSAQIRGDMDPTEFRRLEDQVRQKAAAVAHSMPAKSYMKYQAPARMGSAFTEVHTEVLDDAMKAFNLEMKQLGYNEQQLIQFRNRSSMDPGMDADLGLVEKPDVLPVRQPDGSITYRQNNWLTRNGQPVSLEQWQADARRVMAANYKHVSGGYSAHQSFVDVTTRLHRESYRDKAWLLIPKAGPHADRAAVTRAQDRIFGQMQPELMPHSLGITPEKAEIMFREHPELRPLGSMMEACRGTAKDLDTKFIPLVDAKIRELEAVPAAKRGPDVTAKLRELQETRRYLDQCRTCMADIGKGRTHPGRWMSDFRMITGGEDPLAVSRRLARLTLDASRM